MMLLLHTFITNVLRSTLTANMLKLASAVNAHLWITFIVDAIRIDIYTRFAGKQVVDNLWITCG